MSKSIEICPFLEIDGFNSMEQPKDVRNFRDFRNPIFVAKRHNRKHMFNPKYFSSK